jgi:eukaryotic-like serine/threonine-protein kinase
LALSPGTRLGVYDITALIGEGGMGQVYRATDTTLGRQVAIKILPDAFASDPERLARFAREAKTLASLNHPHVAAIYGFEKSEGVHALVMELVEGEDLSQRLAGGAIPLAEALAVAKQIAGALEAAHEHGIIHRDLKPANIMIRRDGLVKVLDFGLAKLAHAPGTEDTVLPTMSATMTEAGAILGTAPYMAPEQTRGQVVDRRADIWAFGAVVYEMLSGKRAFGGLTTPDVLAAIMTSEPELEALPHDTPPTIRSLIRRCLRKDLSSRLQHIGDARIELQEALAQPEPVASPAPQSRAGRWLRALPWILAALAIAMSFALKLWRPRLEATTEPTVTRLELSLPAGVDLDASVGQNVAISPDGTQVAVVGVLGGMRQLYVRRFDQFEGTALRGTEEATSCFFSPDGRRVAFASAAGTLKTIGLQDGRVSTLATEVNYAAGGSWGLDDRITFSREGTLWQIPASGGTPRQLTTPDGTKPQRSQAWPTVIDAGQSLLFASTTADGRGATQIEALSLATGRRRIVIESGTFPLYAPSGHLIFFRDGVLLAAPFDVATLEVTGSPVRVLENLAVTAGVPQAALSSTGSLVFAPDAGAARRLVWVSRQGAEQIIENALRGYRHPRLSPDGRRIVVEAGGDLWSEDLARGTFARLTSIGTVDGFLSWMPDGTRLVVRTTTGMRIIDADGSGRSQPIAATSAVDYPNSVSPDGQTLAFTKMAATGDLFALSLRGEPRLFPILQTSAYEAGAQISPDGRWVTYVSDESRQLQVYVRPFPQGARKLQVSTEGGTQALWNKNGREIFYRSGNRMMSVNVSTTPDVTFSAPRLLFDRRYALGTVTFPNYDVSPDGQRFVMVRDESGSGHLNVVLNWQEELKQRVPTR